jgi:predicted ATP-grasp superfamily ATP-dependent carboligase
VHELLKQLAEITQLRDPLLIAGFADRAGEAAASTVSYLVEHWDAEPLAEIDVDELFNFTARRPLVRTENGERVLHWPTSRLHVATPAGAERDVVLLAGVEPHLKWGAFCDAIASFMAEVGATTSLTLGSYPGSTPHTRTVPVRLSASDEAYGRTFGLEPSTSTYEGPTGIVGVLNVHQRSQGFRTASLSAMTPFYLPAQQPNPHVMLALIDAIDRGLGTSTPLAALQDRAAALDRDTEGALHESEQLRALVQSLEEQFDWIRGSTGAPVAPSEAASDLPPSSEVIAGLEQFLRQQREAGKSSANDKAMPT